MAQINNNVNIKNENSVFNLPLLWNPTSFTRFQIRKSFIAFIKLPLLYSGRDHVFCLLSSKQIRAQKQRSEVTPVLSVLSRVIRHWTIVYMHVLWLCLAHSNCGRILPFFQKYTWTAYLDRHSFSLVLLPCFASVLLVILKKSVIQELRARKNGLIKRFSRVGPIITHSRESSNSQRDPQDHAHS